MTGTNLGPLQVRVLELLSEVEPRWALTGGGALILALGHRTTRDLDLLWSGRTNIADISRVVRDVLQGADMEVAVLQSGHSFERLTVSLGSEAVILDLMAEPTEPLEPPVRVPLGQVTILTDTTHAILVNKLCTLLGRMELRDLDDVRHLLAAGGDLLRAVQDAPRRDGGFSALTLAWVLESFPAHRIALASAWTADEADSIDAFKNTLIQQLTESSAPD
jgi:hypothetical protein